jgi:hypothetical protein
MKQEVRRIKAYRQMRDMDKKRVEDPVASYAQDRGNVSNSVATGRPSHLQSC